MAKSRFQQTMSLWEDKRILELVDQVATARGSDRSGIYREAIRFWLAKNKLLPERESAMLGVTT